LFNTNSRMKLLLNHLHLSNGIMGMWPFFAH